MKSRTRIFYLAFLVLFLLLGSWGAQVGSTQSSDPGALGPFGVTREEYNFGDTAFTPTNFPGPVELLASVHYPTGLPGGPYPLVVFLHGRHATCFTGRTGFLLWPCSSFSAPLQPIPSYRGYDYIAEVLASNGY